ncbi:hypothetical protein [Clostridium sp. E02]|uniref:hypothetical protein n=1 Tax=Clostridium sp. E02 TaxID=2487134 RepID=UPI000F520EA3|nr:hypothetical protein [Clostridium sp. E02]
MARSGSKNTGTKAAARFTKQQLLLSEMYCSQSDLLCALLEDEKKYTLAEAEELMNQFKKGKVNVC